MQKAFVDEHEEALVGFGARHRNRDTDLGRCGGHQRDAADGIHRGTGSLPSRASLWPNRWPSRAGFSWCANEWLNSPPLTASALRGKVVLIDFWTYTCINWLRQLPYVRAWAEKYRDQGLVVIGVHAPEFAFEKDISNVLWAVKAMRIHYPVAVDNEHAIWRAFQNRYWPALYFIDCARAGSAPPFWRGLIRPVGDGHPSAAGRGGS